MENQQLEKVDIICERMDVSYKEAKDALDQAGGDVVAALIRLEEEREEDGICTKWKAVLEKGAASKLRLKKENETLVEVPAGLGAIGLLGMLVSDELAVLGALGIVTALLNNCTLEFVDEDAEDEGDAEQGVPKKIEIQIEA
ncbi:MAG: DUF4342 domain-containing protein [Syntrophaceticus sp.]